MNDADWLRKRLRNPTRSLGCLVWVGLLGAGTGVGCRLGADPGDDGDPPADSAGDTGAPGDTAAPAEWRTLPDGCVAPSPLPPDPLVQTARLALGAEDPQGGGMIVELLEVELDGSRAYAVGQGGLAVVDVDDPAAVAFHGVRAAGSGRFHQVEVLGGDRLAVTNRDEGLRIVDVADPANPVPGAFFAAQGWEGMADAGGHLDVAGRAEGLVTFDIADPSTPLRLGESPGLANPWWVADAGDGWLYVADNTLGVVPVDLADPRAPEVLAGVEVGGGPFQLVVDGDWIYAAVGGAGVVVLDRRVPAAPVPVATVDAGASVVQVAVSDGVLYAAAHEGLLAWDVTDPAAPVPLAHQRTEPFALGVAADGDQAWVADWGLFEGWALDRDAGAGELDLPTPELGADPAGEVQTRLTNRGGGTLRLTGAEAPAGVTVEVGADTLAPGASTGLRITGVTTDTTVCIASDDPDEPTRTLTVRPGGEPPIGELAPDFSLPTLDGEGVRLAEQLGQPVLLVYFATW